MRSNQRFIEERDTMRNTIQQNILRRRIQENDKLDATLKKQRLQTDVQLKILQEKINPWSKKLNGAASRPSSARESLMDMVEWEEAQQNQDLAEDQEL